MALDEWAGLYGSGATPPAGLTCALELSPVDVKAQLSQPRGVGGGVGSGGGVPYCHAFAFCFCEASLNGFNQSAEEEEEEGEGGSAGKEVTSLTSKEAPW